MTGSNAPFGRITARTGSDSSRHHDHVGEVAERADHRDAASLFGIGKRVRLHGHVDAERAASATLLPNSGLYRSSSGCATSATHAGISSGRVVSISTSGGSRASESCA